MLAYYNSRRPAWTSEPENKSRWPRSERCGEIPDKRDVCLEAALLQPPPPNFLIFRYPLPFHLQLQPPSPQFSYNVVCWGNISQGEQRNYVDDQTVLNAVQRVLVTGGAGYIGERHRTCYARLGLIQNFCRITRHPHATRDTAVQSHLSRQPT